MSAPTSSSPNNQKPEMKIPLPMQLSILGSDFNSPSSSASNSATSSTTTSRTQTPFTSGTNTPLTEQFPSYTKNLRPDSIHRCRTPQLDKKGQPLDVLSRKYYKPEEELDIAEALDSPALPGTFRHALEKEARGESKGRRREQTEEEKKAEFERVKRELRYLG